MKDHPILLALVYGISKDIQNSENVYVFKNKVARLYTCYNEKYV